MVHHPHHVLRETRVLSDAGFTLHCCVGVCVAGWRQEKQLDTAGEQRPLQSNLSGLVAVFPHRSIGIFESQKPQGDDWGCRLA
jgi:hypothetical protein